jgi:hypothetical protein
MEFSYHTNFLTEKWDASFKVWNISIESNGDLKILPFEWKYRELWVKGTDRKDYEQWIPLLELEEFIWIIKEFPDIIKSNGNTNNINKKISNKPFRIAFSNVPLKYNGDIVLENPFNKNNEISINFIKDHLAKFSIPLTVNTNLNWFHSYLTPPDAKLVKDVFTDNLFKFNAEISKILPKKTEVHKIETFKPNKIIVGWSYVYDFNFSIDPQTASIEAYKTGVIFEDISTKRFNQKNDFYKRDRVYTTLNLESLLDFYTENFSKEVWLTKSNEKMYLDSVIILDKNITNEVEFNKSMWRLKNNLTKSWCTKSEVDKKINRNLYKFDTQKQKFYIDVKDFKLTPPIILFLRDLHKKLYPEDFNSNVWIFIKNINLRRSELGREFEEIMFEALWVDWEVKPTKETNFLTPDYIAKNWDVYDFKLTVNNFNAKSLENYKSIWNWNPKLVYFNQKSDNLWWKAIYYKKFLEDSWIDFKLYEDKFQLLEKELGLLEEKIELASKTIQEKTKRGISNSLYFTL